ncbi:MAG: tryptophan-rich sensory protein [Clostridia bacterium]|nr:tryptophan-rich sensory protein [Clostridia bacterium]
MWEKIKPYIKTYVVAIAIPLTVGILSALFTKDNMDIYEEIIVPDIAPPSWLFPIVWTILYVLMGISSGLVYSNREREPEAARTGLTTYAVSLVINFAWSIIFFNANAFLLAFIWLILLLYKILRTIYYYYKVDKIAAFLQIPYALWVAFAGYLNFSIWLMN